MKIIQYGWNQCTYEFRLVEQEELSYNGQLCGTLSYAINKKRVLNIMEFTCVK